MMHEWGSWMGMRVWMLFIRSGTGGAGHDCLNLNFGKISHRFTRDFTNTDKKIRKWLLYYVKNYFNQKSVEVQRWTPLEIMLMDFVCNLYSNMYAVHVTVALVGVATLNLALPAPPLLGHKQSFMPSVPFMNP